MFKTILIGTLIIACASVAAAQSDDYKRWEIFGGFSHNRIDADLGDLDPAVRGVLDSYEGFNGFNASVTHNVSRYVGFKFDFSGNYSSRSFPILTVQNAVDVNSRIYNSLGGVQLKDNSAEKTFKPFAHALVGIAHARTRVSVSPEGCAAVSPLPCAPSFGENDKGLAGAIGAGLDIRANDRFDIRVIQFDYNPTRLFDTNQHNFRIGFGIVFH